MIYFKLLKYLAILFSCFALMCSPIYFIYSTGNMSLQASSQIKEYLSEHTIGNIGESALLCHKRDVKRYENMNLWCPDGSRLKTIKKFGLQKVGAAKEDNKCP